MIAAQGILGQWVKAPFQILVCTVKVPVLAVGLSVQPGVHVLGKAEEDVSSAWVLATHWRYQDGVHSPSFLSGLELAVLASWGMNQCILRLSLFRHISLFLPPPLFETSF